MIQMHTLRIEIQYLHVLKYLRDHVWPWCSRECGSKFCSVNIIYFERINSFLEYPPFKCLCRVLIKFRLITEFYHITRFTISTVHCILVPKIINCFLSLPSLHRSNNKAEYYPKKQNCWQTFCYLFLFVAYRLELHLKICTITFPHFLLIYFWYLLKTSDVQLGK